MADTLISPTINQAKQDLKDNFATALTRLNEIVADGGTYTGTQVRDAVVDLARIVRWELKRLAQIS